MTCNNKIDMFYNVILKLIKEVNKMIEIKIKVEKYVSGKCCTYDIFVNDEEHASDGGFIYEDNIKDAIAWIGENVNLADFVEDK
tara:strand:- start:251 stop:502 length:252 start_codon:yes stop_codon:yes gene_type:complete